jgi:hypothetical protein
MPRSQLSDEVARALRSAIKRLIELVQNADRAFMVVGMVFRPCRVGGANPTGRRPQRNGGIGGGSE